MAIKRLKPKWNSTNPTSTAAPPASAGETGEFLVNRQTGSAYLKTNGGVMKDVGPVKSVNGQTGDVVLTFPAVPVQSVNGETGNVIISSDDISTDGTVIQSAGPTINGLLLKNAKVIVVDSATDIVIEISSDIWQPLPVYSQILICQKQTGRAVFVPGTSVTIISQGNLKASGGAGTMCSLVKISGNTWMLGGALS